MITGKLEITIKINQFPTEITTVTNGWKQFTVLADGQEVSITIRPKTYNKLEEAQKTFPMWVASITGKMGKSIPNGFILEEANVQIFERKPKENITPGLPQ